MTGPGPLARWRDDRGRLWRAREDYTSLRLVPDGWQPDCIALSYATVEALCGPLTVVDVRARVRLSTGAYAGIDAAGIIRGFWEDGMPLIHTWSLPRAEAIAACFRGLGYRDVAVEVVP
jgi:hypothetical protein